MPASCPHRVAGRCRAVAVVAAIAAACLVPASSAAASSSTAGASDLLISGGGFGHGVGMSQYGALGFALHGFGYQQILAHYYEQTTLATIPAGKTVTVLLADGRAAAFSGATRAGATALTASTTYAVAPAGPDLALLDGTRTLATFAPPLTVSGPGPLELAGHGRYRGSLVFDLDGHGGVQTVDQVDIEDYVRGVVAEEMPSSWPAAALEAQAVAARTYALASDPVGVNFDVYDDTRSQMYGGVAAETPQTDAAVEATAGQVVEYSGVPATTYFFSSSGGYTEDIQNVWLGVGPEPWLQGVPDPFDSAGDDPFHRWQVSISLATAARRLRGLVRGSLTAIQVLKRGVSPRVVSAAIIGTDGRTLVSGPQLQQRLGLRSTYMSFETVTPTGTVVGGAGPTEATTSATPTDTTPTDTTPTDTTPSGATPSGAGTGTTTTGAASPSPGPAPPSGGAAAAAPGSG